MAKCGASAPQSFEEFLPRHGQGDSVLNHVFAGYIAVIQEYLAGLLIEIRNPHCLLPPFLISGEVFVADSQTSAWPQDPVKLCKDTPRVRGLLDRRSSRDSIKGIARKGEGSRCFIADKLSVSDAQTARIFTAHLHSLPGRIQTHNFEAGGSDQEGGPSVTRAEVQEGLILSAGGIQEIISGSAIRPVGLLGAVKWLIDYGQRVARL